MSHGALAMALAAPLLVGCGDLVGLGGEATPLAAIQVEVTGDLVPLLPPGTEGETPALRVALVWARQWLPEPFCFLPPESDAAAAVIAAGCRDSFGFVPDRVAASVAVEPRQRVTLNLFDLPAADVMIGDVTARVAYGSLVVFDDVDGSGTLELRRSSRFDPQDNPDGGPPPPQSRDLVYGASFVSMTLPDQRIGFREGGFNPGAAFYPRSGCDPPPPGFSVLAAGGFSAADALAAALQGKLPEEDPATCGAAALDAAVIEIPLQSSEAVREVACVPRRSSGTTRYREPPTDDPTMGDRVWACAGLPRLGEGSTDSSVVQLVLSGAPDDACKGLTHYTLRGCDNDATCESPQWDHTATPPPWWPCPVEP